MSISSILSEIAQGIEKAISDAASEVGQALSDAVGAASAVGSEISQDIENITNTLGCTVQGMKDSGYTYYPALGIVNRAIKNANINGKVEPVSNIFQLFRHGVIIESAEGNYYYVGGASPYWGAGKDFFALQGGACFFISDSSIPTLMRKANIIVVRLKRRKLTSAPWQQPNPPEGCSTPVIGWFETAAENSRDAGGVMPNYLPYYTSLPFHALKVPGILVGISGDKLSATALKESLKLTSDQPPVPFIVARTVGTPFQQKNPNAVINGMMAVAVLDSQLQEKLCNLFITQDDSICNSLSTVKGFSDALIGAPVFTAYSCLSGCKEPGIVGLVASATQLAGPVVSLVLVPLPTAYTDQAFEQLASALGVQDVFNESVRALGNAREVIISLQSTYHISQTLASAIVDHLDWNDREQMMTDAKPYVENYHKVVEAIRSLVEKSGEMFLVGRIQECVESTVDEDYETWLDEATDCVYSDVDRRSITY
ncbi:hypothetical protein IC006_0965 [Sulfuracidifex tepidarius]|uniref:Uncharacterized protein n=2 Tax=Sulfuracidifex tepidarius TaxID=1294262 RepID=A0A510DU38_9CREN|nr:hypothetical protein [Sulfuracidifex tepidarius]BBG23677.1 hypothetical protein IC006_0965 [Sulfuracidifex tepidarius]